MSNNKLLDQLKDVYLPKEISQLWPLSYGWWVLLVVFIFIIIFIFIILAFKRKKKLYVDLIVNDFRSSIKITAQEKPEEVLQNISVFLKIIAVQKFPKEDVKILHGKAWIIFLDSRLKQELFKKTKANMLENSYRPIELDEPILNEILTVAEKWLRRVL